MQPIIITLYLVITCIFSSLQCMETLAPPLKPERFIAMYQRMLSPEAFAANRTNLFSNVVGFLPDEAIGGMKSPYNYMLGEVNHTLLTTLFETFNVRTIVTLVEEPLPEEIITSYPDISFHHIPISNHTPPSIQNLIDIARLSKPCSHARKMMVHCIGGIERTGTILAALLYLRSAYNMEEIIPYIRHGRRSAINEHQLSFLLHLEEIIRNKQETIGLISRFDALEQLAPREIEEIGGIAQPIISPCTDALMPGQVPTMGLAYFIEGSSDPRACEFAATKHPRGLEDVQRNSEGLVVVKSKSGCCCSIQ